MENIFSGKQKETIFDAAYLKALIDNKKNLTQWKEYKEKYEEVIKNLQYYNEKHQHSIFLPVGSKAYIKGKLVHTNDVWVTLGCGWFLKTSAKKAIEICERRIKSANELIDKWEKESTLLENMRDFSKRKNAFESEDTKEVIEPYDEEKEKDWKQQHREKEKQYRKQLKELKEKTGSANINTEKDIWEHLEALELQEELEDELNRLGCDTESSSEEDESSESVASNDSVMDTTEPVENATHNSEEKESENISTVVSEIKNIKRKKSVTFNLPPEDSSESTPKISVMNEKSTLPEAVSDTVYENVNKPSLPLNSNEPKRPISKFKMNLPLCKWSQCLMSTAPEIATENSVEPIEKALEPEKHTIKLEQRFIYPEFLPDPKMEWRNSIRERLERQDMLKRRSQIEIPEFYVGTIMAVSSFTPHSASKKNRFLGICIQRKGCGLRATFVLRNVIDNLGTEIIYHLYDPTIEKIEVIKLEKRLDDELFYLRDALPEYSTFPLDMEPEILPENAPIPVNTTQVILKPRPWVGRWERTDFKGINREHMMTLISDKMKMQIPKHQKPWEKYDLMKQYRATIPEEEQKEIFAEVYSQLHQLELNKKKSKRIRTFVKPKKSG